MTTVADDTAGPRGIARDAAAPLPETALALAGPAIVVALCWLRSPAMLSTGRFWAEDTMFFGWAHGEPTFLGRFSRVHNGGCQFLAAPSRVVARQLRACFENPVNGWDAAIKTNMTAEDWKELDAFAGLINMPREGSDALLRNRVPLRFPRFGAAMTWSLHAVADLFAPVTLGSTALALIALARVRGRADLRPEIVLVATALFVMAFVATTAPAHTVDIDRHATDILRFSLLWWLLGAGHLVHLLALLGGRAAPRDRGPVRSSPVAVERPPLARSGLAHA